MKHWMIQNTGEIEVEAIHLIGASTKRDDATKIGFFGSGNKYALAFFLRNGMSVKIYSGLKEIKIDTVRKKFRETEFDIIRINGNETSLTTDLGPKWKLWHVIREFVTNAMDEGMLENKIIGDLNPESYARKGITTILVSTCDMLLDHIENMRSFIIPDAENPLHSVTSRSRTLLAYKKYPSREMKARFFKNGMLISSRSNYTALFDYDFADVSINEMREVESVGNLNDKLADFYFNTKDHLLLEQLLEVISDKDSKYIERRFGAYSWSMINNPKQWAEAIGDSIVIEEDMVDLAVEMGEDKRKLLPLKGDLVRSLKKNEVDVTYYFKGTENAFSDIKITDFESTIVEESIKWITECNLIDCKKYPIKVVKFTDENVLGMAHEGSILIGKRTLTLGKVVVVQTIVEEYYHLESKFTDRTREFQNYIFEQFINVVQQITGKLI